MTRIKAMLPILATADGISIGSGVQIPSSNAAMNEHSGTKHSGAAW